MAHDAACKDRDDLTPEEVASLLDLPHDLRGVEKEECLEAVRLDKLLSGAEAAADQGNEIEFPID